MLLFFLVSGSLVSAGLSCRHNRGVGSLAHPWGIRAVCTEVEGEQYTPAVGSASPHTFETAGQITVSATYTPLVGDIMTIWKDQPARLIACLGEDGPILSSTRIDGNSGVSGRACFLYLSRCGLW